MIKKIPNFEKNYFIFFNYFKILFYQINTRSSTSYIFIGLTTNLISLLLFVIQFEYLKFSSLHAQFFSSSLATFLNYLLNSKFTFKVKKIFEIKKGLRYLLGLSIKFLFMRLCFLLFYNISQLSSLSYLLSLILTIIFFFFWQKFYVFNK